MNGQKWTPEQVAYLRANYTSAHIGDLCMYLQRGIESIHKKASKLNLRRATGNTLSSGMLHGLNGSVINFNKSTGIRGEVLPLKPLNLKGKTLVKIDHRTWVYMNPGQTVEDMMVKYSRPSLAANF